MRKSILALAVGLAGFAATAAHAGPFYVGVDGVQAHVVSPFLTEQNSTGADVAAGFQVNKNVAVEASYGYQDGFRVLGDKLKDQRVAVSVVGSVPVKAGFSVYGRVGEAFEHVTDDTGASSNGTNPFVGVGVKYDINNAFAVRAEEQYQTRTADTSSAQANFSLGGLYRF